MCTYILKYVGYHGEQNIELLNNCMSVCYFLKIYIFIFPNKYINQYVSLNLTN